MNILKFKRYENSDAFLPTRNEMDDAGLDIYALTDVEIPACEIDRNMIGVMIGRAKVSTGLSVEIASGYKGTIKGRSGLAFKHDIVCFEGTIDSSYRGELGVLLWNLTARPYFIRRGDRIAQLTIEKCELPEPVWADELSFGARGENGFGASGR